MAFCLVPVTHVGQHAAGDQTMHVNVTTQVLPPGVQHRRHAQLAAKVPGVAPKLAERIPRRCEQTTIDHLRMDLNPAVQGMGQREHQVEVRHRQQQGPLAGAPLFRRTPLALRAVPIPAPVIADGTGLTMITTHLHTAHAGGSAIR